MLDRSSARAGWVGVAPARGCQFDVLKLEGTNTFEVEEGCRLTLSYIGVGDDLGVFCGVNICLPGGPLIYPCATFCIDALARYIFFLNEHAVSHCIGSYSTTN